MEPIHLTIEQLGSAGDGIATHAGKRLYIPATLPGEEVTVRLPEKPSGHPTAEVVSVTHASPDRTTPPCRHFGICGGCKLQHMKPQTYFAHKQAGLRAELEAGGLKNAPLQGLLSVPHASRRRVEWQVWRENGPSGLPRWHVGYFRYHSHEKLSADECPVLEPALQQLLPKLPYALEGLPIPLNVTAIQATWLDSGIDLTLQVERIPEPADWQAFAQELGIQRLNLQAGPRIKTVYHYGESFIRLGDYAVQAPPGIFLQAARQGQAILTDSVLRYLQGCNAVADLFSGIGAYSFPLLSQSRLVEAFEGEGRMVSALQAAVAAHGLKGRLLPHKRDLFSDPLTERELHRFDGVVINPPRAGAASQCKQLAKSGVPVVAYVSCNPERFVRDAKMLQHGGYQLREVIPVDQFIWSPHLELVALFTR